MTAGAHSGVDDAREAALVEQIQAEIGSSGGRMTFARFMELALYEPELGYYRTAEDRPTDAGDFLSAPETHAIFGWTLSNAVEAAWRDCGEPVPFTLIEYAAGSGTLALAIFEGLRMRGAPLADSLRYVPIELNVHRLHELRQRFGAARLGDRLADPSEHGPVPGFVVANEFLDALPVHRVALHAGELRELYVTWRDGLAEEAGPPSTPALGERLRAEDVVLAEGQQGEICLAIEDWLRDVSSRLALGRVLVIDYGYEAAALYGPRHMAGTLLSYAGHALRFDPFVSVGRQDLTAHVDFTAVRALAAAAGFGELGYTTQSRFLLDSGLEDELRRAQAAASTTMADYARLRSGVVRMLDPRAMGAFRVLLLER